MIGMIWVKGSGEELLLLILDSGAEDAIEDDEETVVYTEPKQLATVRNKLQDEKIEIVEAELTYVPQNIVTIADEATQGKVMRLMDVLEELDDVVTTHTNFDIA